MSDYTRQPLLNSEEEAELKAEMEPLWLRGMPTEVGGLPGEKLTGGQIARMLGFGEPGVYEKLKYSYIYFYRQKFDLPIRNKPPFAQGERRYKNPPEDLGIMMPDEFVQKLNDEEYHKILKEIRPSVW
jgi:hypothetical protein